MKSAPRHADRLPRNRAGFRILPDTLTGCREIEPDFAFDGRSRILILRVRQRRKARMPHGCAALFLFLLIWKAKPLNKTVFTGNDMLFYKIIFARSDRLYRQSERRAKVLRFALPHSLAIAFKTRFLSALHSGAIRSFLAPSPVRRCITTPSGIISMQLLIISRYSSKLSASNLPAS